MADRILCCVNYEDITERKQAEEAQRESESRFQGAFETSAIGMALIAPKGRFLQVNPSLCRITGYSGQELLSLSVQDITHPDDEAANSDFARCMLAGEISTYRTEKRYFHKAGHEVWVLINVSIVRAKSRPLYFVAQIQDITESRHAQDALSSKQQQLEELNRVLEQRIQETVAELRQKDQILINQSRLAAMGEMIGNIAHQWRQPLNALGLIIANIKDAHQFNTLDAAYLNQAAADGNRLVQKMSTTISDFANFFRPDKEIVSFSGKKQIDAAILLVESSFRNRNIAICFEAPHDLMLSGFPNEYSQVLLNLLYNAKDAILAPRRTGESGIQG